MENGEKKMNEPTERLKTGVADKENELTSLSLSIVGGVTLNFISLRSHFVAILFIETVHTLLYVSHSPPRYQQGSSK